MFKPSLSANGSARCHIAAVESRFIDLDHLVLDPVVLLRVRLLSKDYLVDVDDGGAGLKGVADLLPTSVNVSDMLLDISVGRQLSSTHELSLDAVFAVEA